MNYYEATKQLADSGVKVGDVHVVSNGFQFTPYILTSIILSPKTELDKVQFEKRTRMNCEEVLKKLQLINNADIEVILMFNYDGRPLLQLTLSEYQGQLKYATA